METEFSQEREQGKEGNKAFLPREKETAAESIHLRETTHQEGGVQQGNWGESPEKCPSLSLPGL